MSTSAIKQALRKRHDASAWALMFEVADSTGYSGSTRRWADAVAMSLWPSRGLHLHGYEIKASRSDWLRELKNPAKAEVICKYCDYWNLAVTDSRIVRDGELPETWGLLALDSKGNLKTVKKAPKLEPAPVDVNFLAALLRAAQAPAFKEDSNALQKAYEEGRQEQVKRDELTLKRLEKSIVEVNQKVIEFETAAGFRLEDWKHKAADKGRIVRDVLNGMYDRDRHDLEDLRRTAVSIISRIDESGLLERLPQSSVTEDA